MSYYILNTFKPYLSTSPLQPAPRLDNRLLPYSFTVDRLDLSQPSRKGYYIQVQLLARRHEFDCMSSNN